MLPHRPYHNYYYFDGAGDPDAALDIEHLCIGNLSNGVDRPATPDVNVSIVVKPASQHAFGHHTHPCYSHSDR